MTVVFWIIAALAAITAVGVVTLRNPVHIALTLVLNTACLALLYLSMSAEFLAVAQLLLYAGGIMVLFLFILTLLGPDLEQSSGQALRRARHRARPRARRAPDRRRGGAASNAAEGGPARPGQRRCCRHVALLRLSLPL